MFMENNSIEMALLEPEERELVEYIWRTIPAQDREGMTADDNHVVRRKITIVKRLRGYIDALMAHKELHTSILPLGDGVTVSVKI